MHNLSTEIIKTPSALCQDGLGIIIKVQIHSTHHRLNQNLQGWVWTLYAESAPQASHWQSAGMGVRNGHWEPHSFFPPQRIIENFCGTQLCKGLKEHPVTSKRNLVKLASLK